MRLRKGGISGAGKKDSDFRAQPWERKPPSAKENALFDSWLLFLQDVLQEYFLQQVLL
jgi:hypothetical protein